MLWLPRGDAAETSREVPTHETLARKQFGLLFADVTRFYDFLFAIFEYSSISWATFKQLRRGAASWAGC